MSNINLSQMITAEAKKQQAAARARTREIAKARASLDATDWYVTRHAETGQAIPENIRAARAKARRMASGDQAF